MATTYTTTDLVADQLRRDVRVKIGQAEPSESNNVDISFTGIDTIRARTEADIALTLGRFYSLPLALTHPHTINLLEKIATELAAYNVWLAIHPTMTRENIPASVLEWKKNADAMLEKIVPTGKSTAQAGRDIILEGETLLAGAGTPGTVAVALSKFVPFGGSE